MQPVRAFSSKDKQDTSADKHCLKPQHVFKWLKKPNCCFFKHTTLTKCFVIFELGTFAPPNAKKWQIFQYNFSGCWPPLGKIWCAFGPVVLLQYWEMTCEADVTQFTLAWPKLSHMDEMDKPKVGFFFFVVGYNTMNPLFGLWQSLINVFYLLECAGLS